MIPKFNQWDWVDIQKNVPLNGMKCLICPKQETDLPPQIWYATFHDEDTFNKSYFSIEDFPKFKIYAGDVKYWIHPKNCKNENNLMDETVMKDGEGMFITDFIKVLVDKLSEGYNYIKISEDLCNQFKNYPSLDVAFWE